MYFLSITYLIYLTYILYILLILHSQFSEEEEEENATLSHILLLLSNPIFLVINMWYTVCYLKKLRLLVEGSILIARIDKSWKILNRLILLSDFCSYPITDPDFGSATNNVS